MPSTRCSCIRDMNTLRRLVPDEDCLVKVHTWDEFNEITENE